MLANFHSLPPLLLPLWDLAPSESDTSTRIFPLSLLVALLTILGTLIWTIFANKFDEILCEDKQSEALTALIAIFTPTKSSWPSDILDATRRASVSHSRPGSSGSGSGVGLGKGEIRLKFSAVYEHIINGDLELQPTASVDLVKAMLLERDGMEVDGWKIKVIVEWKWVLWISLWVVKGLGSKLLGFSELWNADLEKSSHLLERAKTSAHSPEPVYALDSLPLHQHELFARQLYTMLRSTLPPRSGTEEKLQNCAIVTFSTICGSLVLLSTITLCGLPLFLRVPRVEPTPVLIGLRRSLRVLGARSRTGTKGWLRIESIDNDSEAHVRVLSETIKRMEGDDDYRQRLVQKLGVKGWRREMFCLELEAALYKAGLMKRWKLYAAIS